MYSCSGAFRSTEKFSVNFKLKGKSKRTSVITKAKVLIYQPVKIMLSIFSIFVFNDLSITFCYISEGLLYFFLRTLDF